jgi:putative hydrolase of the HAD superfamily
VRRNYSGLRTQDSGLGIRGVFFDFYDTLGYIESAVVETGRRELAQMAGLGEAEFAPLWRANREARTLGTAGDLTTQLRDMLGSIGLAPPASLIAEMARLEERAWERAVRLYPDTKPALRELRRRGYRLGIISNCSVQAGAMIDFHGLRALVDTTLLSFEVGVAKPDPAIYEQACAALGLPPEACGFVADGAGGELEGARAVGLLTVRIDRPDRRASREGEQARSDRRVGSLDELLELLGSGLGEGASP